MLSGEEKAKLIEAAQEARKMSYSPYSGFKVGASLLTADGRIYTGCNIENAAYTPTNCAERTAVFKAVSEGVVNFKAIAVIGSKSLKPDSYAAPCGVCRQVLREFVDPETFVVLIAKNTQDYRECTLAELLPESFGPENLM